MLRNDGPDYAEQPAPRTWSAWQNDDYEWDHVTRANGASWCTSTVRVGFGGWDERYELCHTASRITGTSVTIEGRNPPITQTRCGDAPATTSTKP